MGQIVHAAVETYLESLHPAPDPLLDAMAADGQNRMLPLVHRLSAQLLSALVLATGARRVLEIGTCTGYSTIWMARRLAEDGMLISVEVDPARAAIARANVERAGLSARVSVIVGDATRYLHKVSGPFDLVFQDADKQLYETMLDRLVVLLRPRGLLVTDNVLWNGEVVEGYVSPPRRDPAETEALRRYNARLAGDTRLVTTFLPVGDGLSLSVKV